MTHKHKQSNHLLRNKIITASIVLSIIIVFISVKTYVSPIQQKLQGSWNVEFENSYIERDSIYQFSWSPINITKDTIQLPMLLGKGLYTFFENLKDTKGTWKVISKNPDSVFFNVPKNPLHGKYAIRFFIDKNGWTFANMRNNTYKIELTNDSTYLICNKAGFIHKSEVKDWERKN